MSGWTDSHTAVAAAFAALSAGSLAGLLAPDPVPYAILTVVALLLVSVAALQFDALGGIALGLGLAALVIAAKRLGGGWTPDVFWYAFAETAALVAAGSAAGFAGRRLRPRAAGSHEPAKPHRLSIAPAFGSLGLLDADLGMARLEEEVERAREHERPLALAVFSASPLDESLSAKGRAAGLRVMARAVETRLREADVPFALNDDEVAAILPETDRLAVWDRIGPITDAVYGSSFRDRDSDTDRQFADCFDLNVGFAELGARADNADALLDAATVAVRRRAVAGVAS